MLDFFRRYQRYFFMVITVVIVISFSFFGTYSTLSSNSWREQIAFKAINGTDVTRFDLDEMATFLATDNEDKMLYGGVWGPNFLNDGVIRKDFLETGLGQELALAYSGDLKDDIDKRLTKEKKYTLYAHPQARFLSIESVWNYFSPEMKTYFDALRFAQNGLDPDAFDHRVKLYLAEKQLPASTIKSILRYQEKQYHWLKPDDLLNQLDLSLFGYHTLEDWFGPHFTRLVSQFIINAAILAEAQGYDVSKAEVLADLVRNTQLSYQQNQKNPNLGVTSSEEYFSEQLRRLNMDQARAIKVWRQVLLFRRYFHDAGSTALVDHLASQRLNQFSHENVTLDLYRLPSSLKLANYEDLQNFEIYLYAVTKQNKGDPLAVPEKFLSLATISQKYPELVQKRYELEVAQLSQKELQARIGLRELWNWEVDDQNWEVLKKQFPTLGVQPGNDREQRFEALDHLDPTTRSVIDAFAKQAIVKMHPEWIDQGLSQAKSEKMVVGLRMQGGKMPFNGLNQKTERQAFIDLLDQAPLNENVASNSPLYGFTADDQAYYRVTVLHRQKEPEILTFAEAKADGTLNEVRDRILEKHYMAIRNQQPLLYQKANKEWQSFSEARELVANQFFEKIITALEPIQKTVTPWQDQKSLSKDQAASLRFYSYLNKIKERLQEDPAQAQKWIKPELNEESVSDKNVSPSLLADQWKVEQTKVTFDRRNPNPPVDIAEALSLVPQDWSTIKTPVNGDLLFYQAKDHGITEIEPTLIAQQVRQMQSLLSYEAQRHLMRRVLQELKDKNALSLAYLSVPLEEMPSQETQTIEPGY